MPFRSDASARCIAYALEAAREAWHQARVDEAGLATERIALCLGTSHLDQPHPERGDLEAHWLAEIVGDRLAIRGPRITF